MDYNTIIYLIIILGLIYLFTIQIKEKLTNSKENKENSFNLPNLNEIELNTKKELEGISNKNQQFFFYPSNENTAERMNVDQIVHSYLYF